MKYFYSLLGLLLLSLGALAQGTTTATYNLGDIASEIVPNPSTNNVSSCFGSLTVNVPAGRYVTAVDVEYRMEAPSGFGGWLSEQASYLECATTSTKESSITPGPVINSPGTHNYSRNGLILANGIVPPGGLTFNLHVFRTWGGSGCNTNFQKVQNNTFKITVHHSPPPTCPPPSAVVVNSVLANSANLGWTSGGATDWQIEYGPQGFTPGTGSIVNATSNPFNLSGLSPGTSYQFRVRDSCGVADVSFWTPLKSFRTTCAITNAPWTEDFESVDWVASTFGNVGSIDTCFSRNHNNNFTWETGPPQFSSFNSGPSGDHTTGSGKYIFSEINGFTPGGDSAVITTPSIDLSSLNIPELSFWYHMYGGSIGTLRVGISNNGGASYNTLFSITGQQQNAKAAPWLEKIINLSAYANDTVSLKFVVSQVNFGTNGDVAIDDIDIHEQPSCPKPSGLSALPTADGFILNWTSGGASNWQIEYGPQGFTPGTGTIVNANSNPFTLSGLSPNTNYDVRLRDSCGVNDVSVWTLMSNFRTACSLLSAPWTEDFESSDWVASNFFNVGDIDTCYTRNYSNLFTWETGPPQFSSFNSGPSGDHTTGSGKYIFSELSGFSPNGDSATIVTPEIDLSSLTTPELSFWYHMYGGSIGTLRVGISNNNGASYATIFSISGQQQSSKAAPWSERIINLSAYTNDTVSLKFVVSQTTFGANGDVAIDDIDIHELPSCPKPSDLSSTSRVDGFIMSWTSGGASDWQIEYGPKGFTPGSGTRVTVSSNPYTLSGLSPNTVYDLYVRDSCGVADVSAWSAVKTDTTLCSVFATPFTENFDGPDWTQSFIFNDPGDIDNCWSRSDTLTFVWKVRQGPTNLAFSGPDADHTTGNAKYLFTDRTSGNPLSTSISSPAFDLNGLSVPELRFWYHMYGSGIDKMEVEVLSGTTWTNVATINGQQQTSKTDPWEEQVISLSSYANDTIQVRIKGFRTASGFYNNLAIDDFWIGEAPTCPRPTNLSVSNITTTGMTLSWTTGGASNWQVMYRPSGSTGPFTMVSSSTNPFAVTGLNPATTYEFWVRDSCGPGDVSFWLGPVYGTTLCGVIIAPWIEDFNASVWVQGAAFDNAGNQISPCWTRPSASNPNFGPRNGATGSTGTGPNNDVWGVGSYIYTEASGAPGAGQITSPSIHVPANLLSPRLKFAYHMYGANIIDLKVQVNNGSGFTNVRTITGQQQTSNAAPWIFDSISLGSYSGDTIQIRFIGTNSGFRGDVALDNVEVKGQVLQCPEPTNITFSAITPISADVSWSSPSGVSELELVPIGQAQGTGTLFQGVSSTFSLTGLTPATTYVIYLRDSCGSNNYSVWITDTLTTLNCPVVTAGFSQNANILALNFNSTATAADSVYWDFGDGNSSSLSNPSHTYANPGSYSVSQRAYNNCGNGDTLTISINVCDSLIANYTHFQSGDTVFFDGSGSVGANEYLWYFGNADTATGATANRIFASSGTKQVSLIVTNACNDTVIVTKNIKVCGPPQAIWTYTNLGTTGSGMKIEFDASASVNSTQYEWDFGDGNTNSGSVKPVHTYITPGLFYFVKLTVTNSCGDKNSWRYRLSEIGLEELDLASSLELYPNPATQSIFLEWSYQDYRAQQVSIIDARGRLVMQKKIAERQNERLELDVSGLAPGYYSIDLSTNQGSARKAFLKK